MRLRVRADSDSTPFTFARTESGTWRIGMTDVAEPVYYDPYDFAIDDDPYPVWRRLREERPLYYNDQLDFFALSRYEDVGRCLGDWDTYRSGKGSVLAAIQMGLPISPGNILMEDPPIHDVHRGLLVRVFSPTRLVAIEPKVRAFCVDSLDPLVGSGGFDFVRDLGAQMPMRTIGMLLGIPPQDQEPLRDIIDEGMRIEDDGTRGTQAIDLALRVIAGEPFADYIDWRAKHPSDDLMTDLLNVEFEDETGTVRRLRREEVLGYVGLIAAAGNETTTRLIGWAGKLLGEHPDQRQMIVDDPTLIRGAVEEILRYESPSPVQARWVAKDVEHYGTTVPAGSIMLALNGSANRDDRKFPDGDRLDIRRKVERHLAFGYGLHFCLGAALARLEGRVALEEVVKRFPSWEVDWENAKRAHTATVRGWERMPVFTP
jgi:cytochrome P450